MKTFLIRSVLGILFGAFLSIIVTFAAIYFGQNEVLNADAFVKNTLGMIFSGWFFTVTPLYFENTNLKLYQQTALHFVTVILLSFFLAFVIGWIPFTLKAALLSIGFFIFIYLLIWTSLYFHFRNQVKKLNAELKDF